jgi:hypothetical protein
VKYFSILILLVIAVSGCSQLKLVYSFGGDAIQNETEFYLDLNEEEGAALERRIEELVSWHRVKMLPLYAEFFRKGAEAVDRGALDEPRVRLVIEEMQYLLRQTVEGAVPHVATVMVGHTKPRKLNHLRARMAERSSERRKELEVPKLEWLSERTESSVRRFRRFFGDLSEVQVAMVRRYFAETAGSSKPWQRVREDRRQAFLAFLSGRPDQDQIAKFLSRIMLHSEEIVGPEYKRLAVAWWARFTDWMVEMMGSLDANQRQYFSKTLRNYADDMIDLSS